MMNKLTRVVKDRTGYPFMIFGIGLMIIACLLLPMTGWAKVNTMLGLVDRLTNATAIENYYGEILYYRMGSLPRKIILARLTDGSRGYEAIDGEDNGQIELMWEKGRMVLYAPSASGQSRTLELVNGPTLDELTATQVAGIRRNYTLEHNGITEVAGRKAEILYIKPNQSDRYQYRAWIDAETGILLGASRRNENGEVTESFYFKSIEVGQTVQERFKELYRSIPDEVKHEDPDEDMSECTDIAENWQVDYLPDGFVETAQLTRRFGKYAGGKQWVFSDGLNTLSIFFKKRETKSSEGLRVGRRSVGSVAALHKAGYEVVVIGEVPIHTAVQILTSIQKKTP